MITHGLVSKWQRVGAKESRCMRTCICASGLVRYRVELLAGEGDQLEQEAS